MYECRVVHLVSLGSLASLLATLENKEQTNTADRTFRPILQNCNFYLQLKNCLFTMKSIKKRLKLRKIEEYAMEKLVKLESLLSKPVKVNSNKMRVSSLVLALSYGS